MIKKRSNINLTEPLKYWRAKKGYSQSKLAKLANTSALTISQLESGKRKSRGKTLEKILSGFNLSEKEFFSMRVEAIASLEPAAAAKPLDVSQPLAAKKEAASLRLSNLDLELLNRVLNLDFDGKLETLRFLQNLG